MRRSFAIYTLSALLSLCARAEIPDITMALDDGAIDIRAEFTSGAYFSRLVFRILNRTSSEWRRIDLRFDIGGLCDGKPKQWSIPATTWVEWSAAGPRSNIYNEVYENKLYEFLANQVNGCKTEIIKAVLIRAEGTKTQTGESSEVRPSLRSAPRSAEVDKKEIEGTPDPPPDLIPELLAIIKQRDAEESKRAEDERLRAVEEAKASAAAANRRKRLAAQQKRKQAEDTALYEKVRAQQEAVAAAERARIRAACGAIYIKTSDKKVGDLTVNETQQVRLCQALGLYPPS